MSRTAPRSTPGVSVRAFVLGTRATANEPITNACKGLALATPDIYTIRARPIPCLRRRKHHGTCGLPRAVDDQYPHCVPRPP